MDRAPAARAQLIVGVVLTLVASAVLLIVAGVVYGLPPVTSPLATAARVVLGAVAFTSVGLLLGAVVPNARAGQGVGLWPSFPPSCSAVAGLLLTP